MKLTESHPSLAFEYEGLRAVDIQKHTRDTEKILDAIDKVAKAWGWTASAEALKTELNLSRGLSEEIDAEEMEKSANTTMFKK